jgi:hypothetical protein
MRLALSGGPIDEVCYGSRMLRPIPIGRRALSSPASFMSLNTFAQTRPFLFLVSCSTAGTRKDQENGSAKHLFLQRTTGSPFIVLLPKERCMCKTLCRDAERTDALNIRPNKIANNCASRMTPRQEKEFHVVVVVEVASY